MKNAIVLPIFGLLALIPGDSSGFPHGGGRPVEVNRPVVVHTPAFTAPAYRPAVTQTYRPAFVPHPAAVAVHPPTVYRPPVAVNRPVVGVGNRHVVAAQPQLVSRGVYVNRPTGVYRPGYSYYHNSYAAWHHGYWHGWYTRPWLWFGAGAFTGAAAGWLYPPGGAVVYSNPYYVPVPVPVYDYSQPIPVPMPVAVPQSTDGLPTDAQYGPSAAAAQSPPDNAAAAKLLDDARQAFAAKDYDKAQQLIETAIGKSPGDATLHEFRALVLFARQKYQEAAGTIYGVLAVGPGWDWETLRSFYPDPNVFTAQLRALEQFAQANPMDAASRFLLAYLYLVMDYRDAAAKMLRRVVELNPKDGLAANLLNMLENKPDADRPAPGM